MDKIQRSRQQVTENDIHQLEKGYLVRGGRGGFLSFSDGDSEIQGNLQ
jgi:hypothetical protein